MIWDKVDIVGTNILYVEGFFFDQLVFGGPV